MKPTIQKLLILLCCIGIGDSLNAQNAAAYVEELNAQLLLDPSTAQIDPNDRSKYTSSAAYDVILKVKLSDTTGVKAIMIKMGKEGDEAQYFSIVVNLDGSGMANGVYIDPMQDNKTLVIHAGKYSGLGNYVLFSELSYSNNQYGDRKVWSH